MANVVHRGPFLVLVLLMVGCSQEGEWSVGIGENGTLDSKAKYTAVTDSQDSFSKWLDAEIAKDEYGKIELAALKRAYLVPSGTKVLVLQWDHVSKPATVVPISKVRILEGEFKGIAGWAAASQVHQLGQ